jgi:ATP-dependent RNA helicase DDX24/MAK5
VPRAATDADASDGDDDGDGGAMGTLKPPSSKKRKRAAAAAAAAAAAPESTQLADVTAWAPFGLHPSLLAGLAQMGFAEPTPIQRACLPVRPACARVLRFMPRVGLLF